MGGVGAHDAAGRQQGPGDAMAVVDEGVCGVDGDLADVAETSEGCGTHC